VKLAAIDIGTNSIHVVVVEATGRGSFEVIDREKRMVKLGAGLWTTHRLSERAFADGLEVLRRYYKLAESRGVDEILAVATSATREADNGTEFLDAIFRETGLMPRVISGMEEARLIFLAARHAIDIADERACVIDIGGGSVEVAVGDSHDVILNQSFRLGVQRLLDRVGSSRPLSDRQRYELTGFVQGTAGEVMQRVRELGYGRIIGTSGTIRTLGEAAHLASGRAPARSLNATVCKKRDIAALVERLCSLDEARRSKLPGIGEARADSIHLGGVLLLELLDLARADELTLCDASLREGVILDYLERHGTTSPLHPPISDPRRRSVIELMRKYDRDDPREHHVANLAVSLFDQTARLHGLGTPERELLEYAALLHGIGRHLSYERREAHANYIIRHSALRGFTPDEVELLGLIVRYHRGPRPRKRDRRLEGFDRRTRHVLAILSAFLRLAVALDRGHCQLVQRVHCSIAENDLSISLEGPGELELELWAGRNKTRPLEKALGCSISLSQGGNLAA
jgi:exopolyphosphatase/guanosine-5'-triphosphate,3'-diphosphate pyrophosphatase